MRKHLCPSDFRESLMIMKLLILLLIMIMIIDYDYYDYDYYGIIIDRESLMMMRDPVKILLGNLSISNLLCGRELN